MKKPINQQIKRLEREISKSVSTSELKKLFNRYKKLQNTRYGNLRSRSN